MLISAKNKLKYINNLQNYVLIYISLFSCNQNDIVILILLYTKQFICNGINNIQMSIVYLLVFSIF